MAFVIYNPKTFKAHETASGQRVFGMERTAKGIKTKAKLGDEWQIITREAWHAIEIPMVDRISAQDGKTVMKCRADQIGTCCDPQMERYWTM